jgi:hypothetical protein
MPADAYRELSRYDNKERDFVQVPGLQILARRECGILDRLG